ncbi:PRTRC system ParB family protein [Sphingobium sp. H39-3-25]|uniref:PRTRC system ParB family protein n=1 Tax=Sphingobium arseniciresistens TaxID=3030834 RepID=UPI0023B8BA4A|nr:PRTRC system ParB family protein [Sphingobium arseniciresistens]
MTTVEQIRATLPLSLITKGDNPRRYFDRKKHDELVASIRLRGILQPILLRPKGEVYAIVAGERRYRAGLEAYGPDGEVPVIIREMTDQEALDAAIAENDDRDDPSETEQADAAVRYLAACQGDRAEAARRLGWSRSKLDRRLALAELSGPVKLALDERRIKVGHAELLAAVPTDKQDKALETILAAGLDVGKTRELLMRVTQNLGSACFDKTECTTCPFNSAAQRTLFETHIDDGHCTNPGCFQLKTEAYEKARIEEEERAAAAAKAAAPLDPDEAEDADIDEEEDVDDEATTTSGSSQPSAGHSRPPAPRTPPPTANGSSNAQKPGVTVKSIAGRTSDLREATWRTALARTLAGNAAQAQIAILVAAMSGTLSQIKAETLKGRAGLLVSPSFPELAYSAKIDEIRELSEAQAATVLSAIGAAYAKDVLTFGHVADLARAFDVDLRDVWEVDKAFLERYTKDELRFIAQESGLVAHMGEKAFAKLLGSKKADLIAGMLNRTGFEWAGRLPSSMTLDGQYGARPIEPGATAASAQTDTPVAALAA